jgi:hypothetical protein
MTRNEYAKRGISPPPRKGARPENAPRSATFDSRPNRQRSRGAERRAAIEESS